MVVKARFDTFLGNLPPLASLPMGGLFMHDATRLLVDRAGAGLRSVRRSAQRMGREDVLHLCTSSAIHDAVAALALNASAIAAEVQSSHVVQLLRRHLRNLGLLGRVIELPSAIVHGLVRGPSRVDEMELFRGCVHGGGVGGAGPGVPPDGADVLADVRGGEL